LGNGRGAWDDHLVKLVRNKISGIINKYCEILREYLKIITKIAKYSGIF
jgi:hypothetical protein